MVAIKRNFGVFVTACAALALVASCSINLDKLIARIPEGVPPGTKPCEERALVSAASALPQIQALDARIDERYRVLPLQLRTDRVVNTTLLRAKHLSLNSTLVAQSFSGERSALDRLIVSSVPAPSTSLNQADFNAFARLVSENILRQGTPTDGDHGGSDPFWIRLRDYYDAFYAGKFVSYFGKMYAKPSNSLTITDTEIVQSMVVFMELMFDEALATPVWIGKDDNLYYPGASEKRPTAVKYQPADIIESGPSGCGINVYKAKTIAYLANTFATAASTDTGLTIKSFGGLEVGLGVLGKFSVGDNNTLSVLMQAVVAEIVSRLTVQLTYPILSRLDFGSPPQVAGFTTRRSQPSVWIHEMSRPFVSSNIY
jgi:hypothetical protein